MSTRPIHVQVAQDVLKHPTLIINRQLIFRLQIPSCCQIRTVLSYRNFKYFFQLVLFCKEILHFDKKNYFKNEKYSKSSLKITEYSPHFQSAYQFFLHYNWYKKENQWPKIRRCSVHTTIGPLVLSESNRSSSQVFNFYWFVQLQNKMLRVRWEELIIPLTK